MFDSLKIKKLISHFQAIASAEAIDINAADEVLSNPVWQKYRCHKTRATSKLIDPYESRVIEFLVDQVRADLGIEIRDSIANLERCFAVMQRPCWQLIAHADKRALELELESIVNELMEELFAEHKGKTRFSREAAKLWELIVNSPGLKDKLHSLREKSHKIRLASENRLASLRSDIRSSLQDGSFENGFYAVQALENEYAPDIEKDINLKALLQDYKDKQQRCELAINKIKSILSSPDLNWDILSLNTGSLQAIVSEFPACEQIQEVNHEFTQNIENILKKDALNSKNEPILSIQVLYNRYKQVEDRVSITKIIKNDANLLRLLDDIVKNYIQQLKEYFTGNYIDELTDLYSVLPQKIISLSSPSLQKEYDLTLHKIKTYQQNQQKLLDEAKEQEQQGNLHQAGKIYADACQLLPTTQARKYLQDLEDKVKDINTRLGQLWEQATGRLVDESSLQDLQAVSEENLQQLNTELKKLASVFKDSREIASCQKLVLECLQRIDVLRAHGRELEHREELQPLFDLLHDVQKDCEFFRDFRELKQIKKQIENKIFDNFKSEYLRLKDNNKPATAWEYIQKWQNQLEAVEAELTGLGIEELEGQVKKSRKLIKQAEKNIELGLYDQAEDIVLQALQLCPDLKHKQTVLQQVEQWRQFLKEMQGIEKILDAGQINEFVAAEKKMKNLPHFLQSNSGLTEHGLRWDSVTRYREELQKFLGSGDCVSLSVNGQMFYVLSADKVFLGSPRDTQAQIRIQAPRIADGHAVFQLKGKKYELCALKGSCFANEQQVKNYSPQKGDKIKIGPTFEFLVVSSGEKLLVLKMQNSKPIDWEVEYIVLCRSGFNIGSGLDINTHRLKQNRTSIFIVDSNLKAEFNAQEKILLPGREIKWGPDLRIVVERITDGIGPKR